MVTRAVLICTDEKASNAITQVLNELEVSVEQFQEASAASKLLSAQRYDVVLVDCDDEQEATEVFSNIKSGTTNQGATSIAIVDGKAGVPTAFRLGASLVLTKPVSLEQARGTLRSALAMRRRMASENKTLAAAAARGSATVTSNPPASVREELLSAIDTNQATAPTPALIPKPPPVQPAAPLVAQASAGAALGSPLSIETPVRKNPAAPAKESSPAAALDKPVPAVKSVPPVPPSKTHSTEIDSVPTLSVERETTTPAATAGSVKSRRKPGQGFMLAVAIATVAAACYVAWNMIPAFHDLVLSQYDSAYSLLHGTAPQSQQGVPPVVPARPQPVAPKSPNPANASPSASSAAKRAAIPDGFSAVAPSAQDVKQGAASSSRDNAASASVSDAAEPVDVAEDTADEHVSTRVRPVYPAAARHKGLKGVLVLLTNVDKDGAVQSAQVLSGNPIFAPAAIAAVKQWRYETYYQNGQPVAFQTKVSLQFVPPAR